MVRQRTGRYDAARENPTEVEWPPSPARLVSALLASAGDDRGDDAVLQRLVDADPPEIWACARVDRIDSDGYVVTNKIEPKKGTPDRPGRTNQMRRRVSAVPQCAEFAFVWRDLALDDAELGALARLAWDIPYFGRSTSSAEVVVIPQVPAQREEWVPWTIGHDAPESSIVELPYGDYVAELRRQYDDGAPARALRRSVYYTAQLADTQPPDAEQPVVQHGPPRDLAILRITHGRDLAGEESLRLAEVLRHTIMGNIKNDIPLAVSGKEQSSPHVAYVPLPHVGARQADGHILGAAVMIPHGIPDADRHRLMSALTSGPLRIGDGRWAVTLEYLSAVERRPLGLRPHRWTGGRGGSREWRTATPLMLDRFPKRSSIKDRVVESIVLAGYPEPVDVDIFNTPPMIGGIHRVKPVSGSNHHPRPFVHCGIHFAEPVQGPVLAGALRYRGIGLFAPLFPRQETT